MPKSIVGTEQIQDLTKTINSWSKRDPEIPRLERLIQTSDKNHALVKDYRPVDPPHEHAQQNRDWIAGMQNRFEAEKPEIRRAKRTIQAWKRECAEIARLAPAIAGLCFDRKIDPSPLLSFARTLRGELAEPALTVLDLAKIQAAPLNKALTGTLTSTEKAVLSIIKAQPKGKGILGKSIIAKLRKKRITLTEAALRRHTLPTLKEYAGVVNHRAAGGYLISR